MTQKVKNICITGNHSNYLLLKRAKNPFSKSTTYCHFKHKMSLKVEGEKHSWQPSPCAVFFNISTSNSNIFFFNFVFTSNSNIQYPTKNRVYIYYSNMKFPKISIIDPSFLQQVEIKTKIYICTKFIQISKS